MRRAAALLAGALVLLPAGAVTAQVDGGSAPAPERTAWFTAASGGGVTAPQSALAEDDLKVVRALQPQAFSTLLYRGEGARAGLVVRLRETSAGTPELIACPTVGTDWEAGGSQPMDAAPDYDCTASSFGSLAENGLSVSFLLDERFQVEPGTWSIAVVPAPGEPVVTVPPVVPLPFSADLAAPEAGDFTLEMAFVLPDEEALDLAPGAPAPPPSSGSTGGSSVGSTGGFTAGFDLPGAAPATSSGSAPPLALDTAPLPAPPSTAGPAPGVAGPVPATAPVLARAASAGEDLGGGPGRLLALLALVGLCAAVGYAAGQSPTGPRLIGGRARAMAAVGAVAAAGPVVAAVRDRGIGRFARPRDAAPRRLR